MRKCSSFSDVCAPLLRKQQGKKIAIPQWHEKINL